MTTDLKPCPFCGGSAEVERMGSGRQSMIISCATCGCRLESSDTFIGPHCSWNTRTPVRVKLPPTIIADNDSETGRLRRQFTGQPQTMEVLDKALVIASLKAQGVEVE